MSDWNGPQGSHYSPSGYGGGRKRGREEDDSYGSSYDSRGGPGQRRRYNNYYDRGYGGRGGPPAQYNSPYYGSRYDNVMRIKQDLWKCLESEGSRFKSSAEPRAAGSRHGISKEQYESIRKALEDNWFKSEQTKLDVLTVFSVAVNELPHKHAYFATFLALLHAKPATPSRKSDSESAKAPASANGDSDKPKESQEGEDVKMNDSEEKADAKPAKEPTPEPPINIALEILQHLDKNLGIAISGSHWRNVRFHLRFFALCAHLGSTPLIVPESLYSNLQLLVDTLKNDALSISVRDELALAVGETLLLLPLAEQTSPLRQGLKDYQRLRKTDSAATLFGTGYVDHIDALCDLVLTPPEESPFVNPLRELPGLIEPREDGAQPDEATLTSLQESLVNSTMKTDSLPRVYMRFFDDETTPGPTSGASYLVRSLILDIMELLEPNRKECSRLLLELGQGHFIVGGGRWFKLKKSKEAEANEMDTDQPKGTWILDNTIVELLLSSLFAMPYPAHPTICYTSLLVELCKLSPTTVAPAMGKCVRRSYASLGASATDTTSGIKLDGEGLRRFAEWFGVHLSNFNFTWRWPEWQGDLSLPSDHPKRVLIDRILELEVRLSYFDRIKDTLPAPYKESLPLFQGEAPLPNFEFDNKENPNTPHAETILDLLRSKAPTDEINAKADAFVKMLVAERGMSEEDAQKLNQKITIQCTLLVGSKSFSHFLNLLERYLHLFKSLSSTPVKRQDLITCVWKFFGSQKQLGLIVLDKFLRYRILDPRDVVEWLFATEIHVWSDLNTWDLFTNTIEVAQSRIANATTKLEELKNDAAVRAAKEEQKKQDAAEDATANGDESKAPLPPLVFGQQLIVDTVQVDSQSAKPDPSQSDEMRSVEKQLLVLQDGLSAMLLQSARGFTQLVSSAEGEWPKWWASSWMTQFARQFGNKLRTVEGSDELAKAGNETGQMFQAALDWHNFITR